MHTVTLALVALVIIGFPILTYLNARKQNKHPEITKLPGPKQYPYIGRIHDLPIQYMWNKFKEWSDEFGPIYYTSMLGSKFLIISDESICEDLLVKRAKIYSDRPAMKSLFDSKSTHGSMEYLPLMGKNRKLPISFNDMIMRLKCYLRILVSPTQVHTLQPHRSLQPTLLRSHGL